MLNALSSGDQTRVPDFVVGYFFDHFNTFGDDAFHSLALRPQGGLIMARQPLSKDERISAVA